MAKGQSQCCFCVLSILIIFGVGLLISGIVVAVLGSFTELVDKEIREGVPLKKGSTSFKNWKDPDGDYFIEYYLFNITNTSTGDQKKPLVIQEIGPYTYRKVAKTNVQERLGQTLTYNSTTHYQYDKSRSCSGCDPMKDIFTTVNYPLLVGLRGLQAKLAKTSGNASKDLIERSVGGLGALKIDIFQSRSVDEFLWGYQDPAFAQFFKGDPKKRYALQFNNSDSYISKIHTGEHDVDRVAEYLEWKGKPALPYWNSKYANMINGTGGTRFKPFVEKDDELYALVTEICRSLKLTYDSTVTVHGIDLYRFTPPKDVLESGNVNPENKGFCVTGSSKKCLPSGLLDVQSCKGGANIAPPFVASTPHFYNAEPYLHEMFNLMPKKEKHATFVDIEKNTGVTMQGHKRLQVSFAVQKSLDIKTILQNPTSQEFLFIPTFFTDDYARISEEDADDFKKSVLLPLRVAKAMPYVMIGLGALLLIIAVIITLVRRRNRRKMNGVTDRNLGKENYSI
ncbi:lysosome membrane protein 2-like [Dendronephthya gigantea]|uniref:lysosome membrane protein 2-like n=1 Tax=Dendronephthya gigantea TaxID=151771 RepID=UPI00106A816E|nr:lysosome membrane protein 2-like [Dendronephthya gigantea]XP_028403828.1 lysosome membrane protein 2-like [Dendronephthya gigantea]